LDGGLNTYGYVTQNPLIYYDPNGATPVHAARGAYAVGEAVGAAINYGIAALTGSTLGILLYDAIHSENDGVTDTGLPDKACNDDDYCKSAQKSLIAYLDFIRGLYAQSSTLQDVKAAQKAIQKANKKVSDHNKECPKYKVQPLPPILF
jgi:hypothetical protein